MNKKKIVINSSISIISQLISVLFQFVIRYFFLKELGIELLGINGTMVSICQTLSLADLGVQSAIVYKLYKPLNDANYKTINRLINAFRVIYHTVAYAFLGIGLTCMLFLSKIMNGVQVNRHIYFYFILHILVSTSSYFLAYKRCILYADKKDYVTKIIDMFCLMIFSMIQIGCICIWKNYGLYLVVKIGHTILANLLVNWSCNKYYPFLHKEKVERFVLIDIMQNVKNIFAGKIAGYVYASTDNLIISIFTTVTLVGKFINYTTITNSIKLLSNSILSPIAPFIGNYLVKAEQNKEDTIFLLYTFIRYVIACALLVPLSIGIQDFITLWIGKQYLMSYFLVGLFVADLYIHIVHSACCDYINGSGLFREDRNIEIIGAVSNIILSIALIRIVGIEGVLLGTVISQFLFWGGRIYLVYTKCFYMKMRDVMNYVLISMKQIVIYVFMILISTLVKKKLDMDLSIIGFLINSCVCEIIVFTTLYLFFHTKKEYKEIKKIIIGFITNRD